MIATTTALVVGGIAASLAAAGVGVMSAQQQAAGARQAANYNAAVARNNAQSSQDQAQFQADRVRDQNRRTLGMQRALYAKAGVDMSGSAQDVQYDSAIQGELTALTDIYTGKVAGGAQIAESNLDKARGGWAQAQGNLASAGSILGGVGSATSLASTQLNPRFRN